MYLFPKDFLENSNFIWIFLLKSLISLSVNTPNHFQVEVETTFLITT